MHLRHPEHTSRIRPFAYRVATNHKMPSIVGLFPQKSHSLQGSFFEKCPIKIRHPMHLRHPVQTSRIRPYAYRVAKTHRMPSIVGLFSQKNHSLQGSFLERGLQFKIWHPLGLRHSHMCILQFAYRGYRVAKTHKMPSILGLFPQKSR